VEQGTAVELTPEGHFQMEMENHRRQAWLAEQQRQMMNMAAQSPMNALSAVGNLLGAVGVTDNQGLRYPTLQGLGVPEGHPFRNPGTTDPAAVTRARTLLIEAIGAEAVARIEAGGGYPIRSILWPNVVYVVPKTGKVVILKDGGVHGRSCIDVTGNVPWPDHVLTRIKSIQTDETVVFCTGNMS
jgi:hypothetical protein